MKIKGSSVVRKGTATVTTLTTLTLKGLCGFHADPARLQRMILQLYIEYG